MSYEFFVSIRHLSAKKSQKFISLNTWISMSGVGLGVMALIVVIAVMSGFSKDLRDKILGTNAHAVVSNINRTMLENYEDVIEKVRIVDGWPNYDKSEFDSKTPIKPKGLLLFSALGQKVQILVEFSLSSQNFAKFHEFNVFLRFHVIWVVPGPSKTSIFL